MKSRSIRHRLLLSNVHIIATGALLIGALEYRLLKSYDGRHGADFVPAFLLILAACLVFAVFLARRLARGITSPLTDLARASARLAEGDLSHRVQEDSSVREIARLAASFNAMAAELSARERRLEEANQKLAVLNKSYLDLVSIVSHELKGVLASVVINTHSVREGLLGPLTQGQTRAMNAVAKSLDYFEETVRNFLNLSRLEKGEFIVSPAPFLLKEDWVDLSIAAFSAQAMDKGMSMENNTPAGVKVNGDPSLLRMALNNLVGNAVKYGTPGGHIAISCVLDADKISVTVYNDGRPLYPEETSQLFRPFIRLKSPETSGMHGTGLGLFLARQIAEKHNGTLTHEARDRGNAFLLTLRH